MAIELETEKSPQPVKILTIGEEPVPVLPDLPVLDENPVPEYLRNGVEHPIVASLQQRLMDLGFMDNDEPTQYFGTMTESAVKTFQRQNHLAQDGIVAVSYTHLTLPTICSV